MFRELRHKAMFRAAGIYVAASWFIIEAASVYLPTFGAPEWILRVVIIVAVVFFPVILMLGWSYDKRQAQLRGTSAGGALVYRFDRREIDSVSREIRFDGFVADVQPRVFDLILYLVKERGYRQGDPGLAELRSSAPMDPLYDDPRFNPLLTRVGLPTLDERS